VNLLATAADIAWPFIPESASRVLAALGRADQPTTWPDAGDILADHHGGRPLASLPPLFVKLSQDWVAQNRARFAGR